MAKYITTVPGSLEQLRKYIYHNGPNLGATLSLEEEISGTADGVKYLIGTYERYAVLGENRKVSGSLLPHPAAVRRCS